jgi:DNA modification methylase
MNRIHRTFESMPRPPINRIIQGNALDVLGTLPDESVDLVVTSPPYWGLRSYGTCRQVWDGDPACRHLWGDREKITGMSDAVGLTRSDDRCRRCRAWRGELGAEPFFIDYVQHLCSIFDEVRRVLKDTGTLWVNLGDTYGGKSATPKSLCQIPSRFAIEMTNRGWILRNEIVWWKPNCLPTPVTDRFTVDFEKIFFFSKNTKYYFEPQYEPSKKPWADLERIMKAATYGKMRQGGNATFKQKTQRNAERTAARLLRGRNKRTVWRVSTTPFSGAHFAVYPEGLVETPIMAGCPEFVCDRCGKGRLRVYEKPTLPLRSTENGDVQPLPVVGHTDCGCGVGFSPGVVLDPFMGSGTTAVVARNLCRSFIGVELNPDYIALANKRLQEQKKTSR